MVQVPVVPDYLQGLTGDQRDIAVAVTNLFRMYGLESLAPKIISFVQAGMSAETISIELTQTPEYKQRFSANDARIKAGLPALSAAEYLATERAYRQVMQAAGLPVGFYDTSSDFTAWLANDVSPTEVKARVDAASEAINSAPAETLDYLKRWYGVGDLVAFALDSKRALPLIEQRISAAEAAATAGTQGVSLGQDLAEQIGRQGFSLAQLRSGFSTVGTDASALGKLADIYGGAVTQDDLVKDVLLQDSASGRKVRGLASQERAAFSGTAGVGKASLGTQSTL